MIKLILRQPLLVLKAQQRPRFNLPYCQISLKEATRNFPVFLILVTPVNRICLSMIACGKDLYLASFCIVLEVVACVLWKGSNPVSLVRLQFGGFKVQQCWTAGVARPGSSRSNYRIMQEHSYTCVCYKHNNKQTKRFVFPTNRIEEVLKGIFRCKFNPWSKSP